MEDLCLDFVNSRFNDHRGRNLVYDRLPMPGWWAWLLDKWDLGSCPSPGAQEVADLRRLRARVRRLLESGNPPGPGDRVFINGVLAGGVLTWRLKPDPQSFAAELVPAGAGLAFVKASIAVSLVEVLGGHGARVQRCGNPSCSFLFRDTTRNGSRRWCDPGMCGNLVKVRAFRAAHA